VRRGATVGPPGTVANLLSRCSVAPRSRVLNVARASNLKCWAR